MENIEFEEGKTETYSNNNRKNNKKTGIKDLTSLLFSTGLFSSKKAIKIFLLFIFVFFIALLLIIILNDKTRDVSIEPREKTGEVL